MTRILLAEDEVLVRELALEDLTDAGCDVVAARDGEEALAILRQDHGFDALFTDIRMPGLIDGWALAEHARQLVPGIRILFASGLADSQHDIAPGDRFLVKPYKLADLLSALEELLPGGR
ncbi:MAG: response regulator [Tsuneonella sp.]